jgi:hypothetical protein
VPSPRFGLVAFDVTQVGRHGLRQIVDDLRECREAAKNDVNVSFAACMEPRGYTATPRELAR